MASLLRACSENSREWSDEGRPELTFIAVKLPLFNEYRLLDKNGRVYATVLDRSAVRGTIHYLASRCEQTGGYRDSPEVSARVDLFTILKEHLENLKEAEWPDRHEGT